MQGMPSDVQVFVRFAEPCVFAGEEVQCSITFRNVADLRGRAGVALASGLQGRRVSLGPQMFNGRPNSQRYGRNPRLVAATGDGIDGKVNRHKATMSLSIPSGFSPSLPSSRAHSPDAPQSTEQGHHRSISTMSESSPMQSVDSRALGAGPSRKVGRQAHTRSSTVQVASSATPVPKGEHSQRACK